MQGPRRQYGDAHHHTFYPISYNDEKFGCHHARPTFNWIEFDLGRLSLWIQDFQFPVFSGLKYLSPILMPQDVLKYDYH